MPIPCITCGKPIPDISDFCPYCGRAVVRELAGEPEKGSAPNVPPAPVTTPAMENNPPAPSAQAEPASSLVAEPGSIRIPVVPPAPPVQATLPLTPAVATPTSPSAPPRATPASQPPVRPQSTPSPAAQPRPVRVPAPPAARKPETRPPAESRTTAPSAEDERPVGPPIASRDRLLSAAAYFTFIPAVVFLFVQQYKRSSFIRFHAWQSVFFWTLTAILLVIGLLASSFGFLLIWMVTGILLVAALGLTWLVLSIKALQGERFQLPGLGHLADQLGS